MHIRLTLLAAWAAACPFAKASTCFYNLAATKNFTLGQPVQPAVTPDGAAVLFLQSGPRDTALGLYRFTIATGQTKPLAVPARGPETLTTEEKARRERQRQTLSGITDFSISQDSKSALVQQAGQLASIDIATGARHTLPGTGWIAPRLSPDGKFIAAVQDNDLHVIDITAGTNQALTKGGTDTLTHGLAEFAASEELGRFDGLWWSPDSATLLYEEADSSGLEPHYIADPAHPEHAPVSFRYPRAGTANAAIRLGLIARAGGPTRWVAWDHAKYPYLARVVWQKVGPLTLILLNREQTEESLITVDAATGETKPLYTERDSAWINLAPESAAKAGSDLPYFLPDGGFLWASERSSRWQLERHAADGALQSMVTPSDLPFEALDDVDAASGTVLVTASPTRLTTALYRLPLSGGRPMLLTPAAGLHAAQVTEGQHDVLIDQASLADGTEVAHVLAADGAVKGTLPSQAEIPAVTPHIQFTTAGARQLDTMLMLPETYKRGQRLPVLLSVYAGPGVKIVHAAPRRYLENQCFADQGFAVVSIDGRGTPGRDHDFERATKYNLIDAPLDDQIDALKSLARTHKELDLSRVGVMGWSFGGYFSAMATIRHPEFFKAGSAGAPVVDFADYDTAYTERYLGLPAAHPQAYNVSNVLSYADALARPLQLLHGLTDDNVYFENTVKLTAALLAAGKPYQLILLPGTHVLTGALRARVNEARVRFFHDNLK